MNDATIHSAELRRLDGGIALITVRNPPVNALTTGVFAAIMDIAGQLRAEPPRAVVITDDAKERLRDFFKHGRK